MLCGRSIFRRSMEKSLPSDIPFAWVPFFQIPTIGGQTHVKTAQKCHQEQPADGTLVDRASECCDPPPGLATYLYNSRNVALAVPANHWAEVQHVSFPQDKDAAWYYLAFGSAVWWNVGKTRVFHDHANATDKLLGTLCKDDAGHAKPATECEQDFNLWFKKARELKLDSLQFTNHYDCGCGAKGPSSWDKPFMHARLCNTEIIDVNGHGNAHGGCASATYKAGWAASRDCSCNGGLPYTNCNNYGMSR